jgi:tetratricopeptide (TPR) repeat protein
MGVTAVSAQSPAITQSTQGWCRPTGGQAGGNLTIVCQGVSPQALKRLNELLGKKDIELQTKIEEAETWAQRYRDLQDRLTQEGQDNSLSQTAKALLEEGKFEEAGAILDRLLASGEKTVEQVAADHVNRAAVYELQFQLYKALPHYEKAYRYRPDHTTYALQYAFTLQKQNHHAKAQTVYQEALGMYRKLAQANPQAHLPYVALTLNNLAVLYSDTQRLSDSEQAYQEALGMYRKLAQANPQAYLPYVAMTLNHLGNLYSDTQHLSDSEQAYQEALGTYRKLAQANPQAYLPDVALTLNNLAMLELDQNHIKQVQVLVSEALIIRRDLYT